MPRVPPPTVPAAPLPEPATPAGRAGLAALLAAPGRAVVGLDFDGTLSPIVDDPDAARAHPGAVPALVRLAPRLGLVAIVTGRPAGLAVRYAGLDGTPGLERLVVLGHYGLERWEAGSGRVLGPPPVPGIETVRRELPAVLAAAGAPEGTYVEDKGRSVAVHTRRSPDPEGLLVRLRGPLAELADRAGLVLEPGRMVLEVRPPGVDKRIALHGLAGEVDPSAAVFVGDDLGDLPAYDAVDELRARGVPGLLVCSGSREVTALAARADLVVDGPAGVVALLQGLGDALAGR